VTRPGQYLEPVKQKLLQDSSTAKKYSVLSSLMVVPVRVRLLEHDISFNRS
jgi:hypothetical protein